MRPVRRRDAARDGAAHPHRRARAERWVQFAAFCVVGASGYVVNLAVFALSFAMLELHHIAAATIAFLVAVANNFVWNRRWTFARQSGRARSQMPRFLAVSVSAFVIATALLSLLIERLDVPAVLAQAVAIAAVTPLSFAANRSWSFKAVPENRGSDREQA